MFLLKKNLVLIRFLLTWPRLEFTRSTGAILNIGGAVFKILAPLPGFWTKKVSDVLPKN